MKESLEILRGLPKAELLWASVREVLNVFQAAACRCYRYVPHDILKKLSHSEAKTSTKSRSTRFASFTKTRLRWFQAVRHARLVPAHRGIEDSSVHDRPAIRIQICSQFAN